MLTILSLDPMGERGLAMEGIIWLSPLKTLWTIGENRTIVHFKMERCRSSQMYFNGPIWQTWCFRYNKLSRIHWTEELAGDTPYWWDQIKKLLHLAREIALVEGFLLFSKTSCMSFKQICSLASSRGTSMQLSEEIVCLNGVSDHEPGRLGQTN